MHLRYLCLTLSYAYATLDLPVLLICLVTCTSKERWSCWRGARGRSNAGRLRSRGYGRGYRNGEYTIESVVAYYLGRIEALDKNGPALNSIICINPQALSVAGALDEELKAGKVRGPLHGIPVVLKDNIDTYDSMPTTAGSRAMANSFPLQDSWVARQLRDAGAVIIGKSNLSEWANFHSSFSSSGWSGLGGQTKNPYDPGRNPCGSSSGLAIGGCG